MNPTVWDKSWLSFDFTIKHRSTEIPANTNLLDVDEIVRSFDASFSDLAFPPLTPFAVGQVHLRLQAFELEPADYVVTFRWETKAGDVFTDNVHVYIDLEIVPP